MVGTFIVSRRSLIYKLPKRATDEDSGAPSTLPEGGPDGTDFGYIDSRMIADGKKVTAAPKIRRRMIEPFAHMGEGTSDSG